MSGELIEFKSGEKSTHAYLAKASKQQAPAVIVLQEWWGLVDHIKEICDRFATAGYHALAPDLYHGETGSSPDEAGRLMMQLNIDQTAKDLISAIEVLKKRSDIQVSSVGVIGFCMGGQLAMYTASLSPDVKAVANFYGIHPNVQPDLNKIEAAVLGIFGEKDQMVTPEVARQLESNLKTAGKTTQFKIFPADHAFFNNTRPEVYNQAAAQEAWDMTLRHFKTYLS